MTKSNPKIQYFYSLAKGTIIQTGRYYINVDFDVWCIQTNVQTFCKLIRTFIPTPHKAPFYGLITKPNKTIVLNDCTTDIIVLNNCTTDITFNDLLLCVRAPKPIHTRSNKYYRDSSPFPESKIEFRTKYSNPFLFKSMIHSKRNVQTFYFCLNI